MMNRKYLVTELLLLLLMFASCKNVLFAREIGRKDVTKFVQTTYEISRASDEMLSKALSRYSDQYKASFFDLFKVIMLINDLANYLVDEKYVCAVEAGLELDLGKVYKNNSFATFPSAFKIASLAAVPAKWSINKFDKTAVNLAWEQQAKLYIRARLRGYSHEFIMKGEGNDEIIFDNFGWLFIVGNVTTNKAKIVPGSNSPQAVYGSAQDVYSALLSVEEYLDDCENIGQNFHNILKDLPGKSKKVSVEGLVHSFDPIYATGSDDADNFYVKFRIRNKGKDSVQIKKMMVVLNNAENESSDCWRFSDSIKLDTGEVYSSGMHACKIKKEGCYTVRVLYEVNGDSVESYSKTFEVLPLVDNEVNYIRLKKKQVTAARKAAAVARAEQARKEADLAAKDARRALADMYRRQGALENQKTPRAASGSGTTARRQVQSIVAQQYYAALYSHIQGYWVLPEMRKWDRNLEATVVLVINQNGQVLKTTVEKKSQDPFFNQVVVKTLHSAAPMPTFPKLMKERTIEVGLRFRPGKLEM
ncbi:energy transducer TonB [Desulfogranum marinum]|uniref:energy transducer TonB n=1 Tax=Desulfogranum marinum TaxID=453220 RepID=UPI0019630125|nr:energy transducer TonB [Desulfogranum marinum]MBM9514886.1 TonB C-terminal domain-containing protein [Desulfogranum marinum]